MKRALLLVVMLFSLDVAAAEAQRGTAAPGSARPATAEAAPPLPDSARFVASSRGRVYYPRSCSAWRSLEPAFLVGFVSEEKAMAAGHTRSTDSSCEWSRATEAAPDRAALGAPKAAPVSEAPACTISAVTDGDTVACADGRRIRLLLIDAPEMSQGPYGLEARRALEEMLPVGTTARVELDVEIADRYQRVLAYLYVGEGQMVNEQMARRGYALQLTYPPNVRHVDRIDAAVEQAREERRGLWSGSAFDCSPRDHRTGRCR